MPKLKNQSEIDAYYLADSAHDRAAGVMWTALVENRIDKLYEAALRPDGQIKNELLRPGGALEHYAVKVRLAYLLGWFGKQFYDDLISIGKIRNRFAHDIEAKSFSDQRIEARLKNMHAYKSIPTELDLARKRVESGDKEAVDLATVLILEGMLVDLRSAFRYCIDTMLWHIDEGAENIKRNLANLAEDWLVADPSGARVDPSSKV
jgi:Mannitol repressor